MNSIEVGYFVHHLEKFVKSQAVCFKISEKEIEEYIIYYLKTGRYHNGRVPL